VASLQRGSTFCVATSNARIIIIYRRASQCTCAGPLVRLSRLFGRRHARADEEKPSPEETLPRGGSTFSIAKGPSIADDCADDAASLIWTAQRESEGRPPFRVGRKRRGIFGKALEDSEGASYKTEGGEASHCQTGEATQEKRFSTRRPGRRPPLQGEFHYRYGMCTIFTYAANVLKRKKTRSFLGRL